MISSAVGTIAGVISLGLLVATFSDDPFGRGVPAKGLPKMTAAAIRKLTP